MAIRSQSGIVQAAISSFDGLVQEYAEKCTEVIEEEGTFEGFGDIVDTGELRDSQRVEKGGLGFTRIVYDVPYAIYVHEGYTHKSGKRIEGRPWTEEAFRRLSPREKMIGLLGKAIAGLKFI